MHLSTDKVEVSEETEKALVKAASAICEPFGIGAAILSDTLTYYRLKCLVSIINKANVLLEKNGFDPKPTSKKFMARFVEDASFEEDDILQSMWANLLVTEVMSQESNFAFMHVLKELNSYSAKLMKSIFEEAKEEGFDYYETIIDENLIGSTWGDATLSEELLKKKKNTFEISYSSSGKKSEIAKKNMNTLVHLEKLGLIQIKSDKGQDTKTGKQAFAIWASLTPFGYDFISACEELKKDL